MNTPEVKCAKGNEMMNQPYQGDNLAILRSLPDASVDLICTDPPFQHRKGLGSV